MGYESRERERGRVEESEGCVQRGRRVTPSHSDTLSTPHYSMLKIIPLQ